MLAEEVRDRVEMTDKQAEQLCEAMKENRHIIIEGGIKSGRSTLLNGLLRLHDGELRILTLDKMYGSLSEVDSNGEACKGEVGSLGIKPIRLILDGVYSGEHCLGIVEALNKGMSILVTDGPEWDKRLIQKLEVMGIARAKDIIYSKRIVRVKLSKSPDNKNKVESITVLTTRQLVTNKH